MSCGVPNVEMTENRLRQSPFMSSSSGNTGVRLLTAGFVVRDGPGEFDVLGKAGLECRIAGGRRFALQSPHKRRRGVVPVANEAADTFGVHGQERQVEDLTAADPPQHFLGYTGRGEQLPGGAVCFFLTFQPRSTTIAGSGS